MAVRLWSTETPTLTPGARRAPIPATPPQVWRRSPTKSACAPFRAEIPYPSPQVRKRGASVDSEAPPPSGLFRRALPKPWVAWPPRRSRKLLPRLATAAPADLSESISVRDGVGGGGIGVRAGVGISATCARAGGDPAATPTIKTKITATAPVSLPPAPVRLARDSREA